MTRIDAAANTNQTQVNSSFQHLFEFFFFLAIALLILLPVAAWAIRKRDTKGDSSSWLRIGMTFGLALLIFSHTTERLLAFNPGRWPADALQAGGLAGGTVLALYGLWLSDRRRRTEEERQEDELRRTEVERGRVVGEQFSKSVELLGNGDEYVRIGALRSVVTLARGNPDLTTTAVEVLCAVLRSAPAGRVANAPARGESRLSAHALLLLQELLGTNTELPGLTVDLSGAMLPELRLSRCNPGALLLSGAEISGQVVLDNVHVAGDLQAEDSTFSGLVKITGCGFDQLRMRNVKIDNGMVLTDVYARGMTLNVDNFQKNLSVSRLQVAEFTKWHLKSPASLDLTSSGFPGGLALSDSTIAGTAQFDSVRFGIGSRFNYVSFDQLTVEGCELPDDFALSGVTAARIDRLPMELAGVRGADGRHDIMRPRHGQLANRW